MAPFEAGLKVGPGGGGGVILESFCESFGEARIGRSIGNSLFPALRGKLPGKLPGMAFPFEKPSLLTRASLQDDVSSTRQTPANYYYYYYYYQ